MDVAGAAAEIAQGVGALAGFFALGWQIQRERLRRRTAHLPPELRSVLLRIQAVADEVITSPRDRAWTEEHIVPLEREFGPLADVVGTQHPGDWIHLTRIRVQLGSIGACAASILYSEDPARISRAAHDQREAARDVQTHAIALLRRLGEAQSHGTW